MLRLDRCKLKTWIGFSTCASPSQSVGRFKEYATSPLLSGIHYEWRSKVLRFFSLNVSNPRQDLYTTSSNLRIINPQTISRPSIPSSSLSSTTTSITEQRASALRGAHELLDSQLYPLGEFTIADFEFARNLITYFRSSQVSVRSRSIIDAESISLALSLWLRCLDDLAAKASPSHHLYFGYSSWFRQLLIAWKNSLKDGQKGLSTMEITGRLMAVTEKKPKVFTFDAITVDILLYGILREFPTTEAPEAAENFLNTMMKRYPRQIKPTSFTYNTILHAWSHSTLPKAPYHIKRLLHQMDQRGIERTDFTYICLLMPATTLEQVLSLAQDLQSGQLQSDSRLWSYVAMKYALFDERKLAVAVLQDRILTLPHSLQCLTHISYAALHIVNAYRRQYDAIHTQDVIAEVQPLIMNEVLPLLEASLHHAEAYEGYWRVMTTWMDLLAHAGQYRTVEILYRSLPCADIVKQEILLKTYGKANKPDLASKFLEDVISSNKQPHLSTSLCNWVLNAWAVAHSKSSLENADRVLYLMRKYEVPANAITCNIMLRILAQTTDRKDTGARAEATLDEMEALYAKNSPVMKTSLKDCRPNRVSYNLTLRACYNSSDYERARRIMQRMELNNKPPEIRSYNEILNHFARMGTVQGAERAEAILDHLKASPHLRLDSVSCNIAIGAWARIHYNPTSTTRIWGIYQRFCVEGDDAITPSRALHRVLLAALLKSARETGNTLDFQRALQIFEHLEQNDCDDISLPDSQFYMRNMRVKIANVKKQIMESSSTLCQTSKLS